MRVPGSWVLFSNFLGRSWALLGALWSLLGALGQLLGAVRALLGLQPQAVWKGGGPPDAFVGLGGAPQKTYLSGSRTQGSGPRAPSS